MRSVILDHVAESFGTGSASECVSTPDVLVAARGIEYEYRFAEYEHDRNSEPELGDEPERK